MNNQEKIVWRDYTLEKDQDLDSWVSLDYSENVQFTNKYALFNEPISKQYEWYQLHPQEISNIGFFFLVAEIHNEVFALFIINYGKDDTDRFVCGINPFVINPKYMHQGYGNLILSDFLANAEVIINANIDVFFAGIDEINAMSTHLFKKFGFVETGRSEDKKFVYYALPNSNMKSH